MLFKISQICSYSFRLQGSSLEIGKYLRFHTEYQLKSHV